MQQRWTTILLASLSATSVLSTPIAKDDSTAGLAKRDPPPVVVAKAPGNSPDCGGKVWSPDELTAAIQQATTYKATDDYQGKDSYPHEFKNRPQASLNPIKWLFNSAEKFDFPNCPDGELLEFPLMRDTSNTLIFKGGKNRPGKNNPDRVIFTYQSDTAATYCGVITHQKEEDDDDDDDFDWWEGEMYTGDFRACDPLF